MSAAQMRPATAQRRREILDAALECFSELGYTATTIEHLRHRSAASVGSIYHHFGDKEGVAAALFLEGIRDYQQAILAQLGDDAERTIRGIVRAHLRWTEANPKLARFLTERRELEVVRAAAPELRELNRLLFGALDDWWSRQVGAGTLRDLPREAAVSIIIGPSELFGRLWLAGSTQTSPSRLARPLGEAAWRATSAG